MDVRARRRVLGVELVAPEHPRRDNRPVSVSEKDRDRFVRIGAAMAEKKVAQRQEALTTTPAERVAAGFLLGAVPRTAGTERALDERARGQIELARAGRRLGTRDGR